MSSVQNIPDVPGQKDTKTSGALLLFKENCLSMLHLIKKSHLLTPWKNSLCTFWFFDFEDSKETCLK